MTERRAKRENHGLHSLRRAIQARGMTSLDKRTTTSRAMVAFRTSLVNALGGPQHISPQRETLVDAITRTKLFIDSLDVWLISQGDHIINKRKRQCIAVLRERQSLVDSMARLLSMVGLDRVEPEINLQDYVREHYPAQDGAANESAPESLPDDSDAPGGAVAPATPTSDEGEQQA
jgi:hypothetical protein